MRRVAPGTATWRLSVPVCHGAHIGASGDFTRRGVDHHRRQASRREGGEVSASRGADSSGFLFDETAAERDVADALNVSRSLAARELERTLIIIRRNTTRNPPASLMT